MQRARHVVIGCLCLTALLATPYPAAADSSARLDQVVGASGVEMFLESGAPGMILAVVDGETSTVVGFGETAEGNGREPDGKTLVRIGSVSKAFAGELLGSLAAEGRVQLTDPLQMYTPDGVQVPTFQDRPITLLDLATHTAALPRQIFADTPVDAADVEGATVDAANVAWPTAEHEYAWLAGRSLPWRPGSAAVYSNFGFDLLGGALAIAADTRYADLLRDRITGPLRMVDTGVAPTEEQCSRLMTGSVDYPLFRGVPGNDAIPCVNTEALAPTGGLYTTADDMVLWLRHNLAPADARAEATLALTHALYRPRAAMTMVSGFDNPPMDGLALGWVVTMPDGHRPLIVHKTGGLAGFMSYVAFSPGTGVGVFVVINRIDYAAFAELTAGANDLISSLVPR